LYEVFTRAENTGVLTPLGKEMYDRFMMVYPHFYGRAGELTRLGQTQHRMLANRMLEAYPQLFKKQPVVNAVSSTYSRCIMSMNAFCDVLRCNGIEVYEDVDGRDMAYIAPYTKHNPKFKGEDQSWRSEYVEYFDTHIDDEIAKGHAEMWLNKSLKHELEIRGVEKHSDFQMFHNFLNIEEQFGYCLTCLGFLNFDHAPAVKL
jgi:hypothetical protein